MPLHLPPPGPRSWDVRPTIIHTAASDRRLGAADRPHLDDTGTLDTSPPLARVDTSHIRIVNRACCKPLLTTTAHNIVDYRRLTVTITRAPSPRSFSRYCNHKCNDSAVAVVGCFCSDDACGGLPGRPVLRVIVVGKIRSGSSRPWLPWVPTRWGG